jgi:hypothetical protein
MFNQGLDEFSESFQILPLKDKYIMAKVRKYSRDMDCVFALFNNQDRLIAFYYDCPFFGNDEYDSLRLETWNPDGNLKLLVNKHHQRTHLGNESYSTSTEVYDFTSIENKIIKILDYPLAYSRYDIDKNITTSGKSELIFEQPDLLKIITTKEEIGGLHGDGTPNLKPLEKDTSFIRHYKQNVVSKEYIEIKAQ